VCLYTRRNYHSKFMSSTERNTCSRYDLRVVSLRSTNRSKQSFYARRKKIYYQIISNYSLQGWRCNYTPREHLSQIGRRLRAYLLKEGKEEGDEKKKKKSSSPVYSKLGVKFLIIPVELVNSTISRSANSMTLVLSRDQHHYRKSTIPNKNILSSFGKSQSDLRTP
jgi:hypothetical protein